MRPAASGRSAARTPSARPRHRPSARLRPAPGHHEGLAGERLEHEDRQDRSGARVVRKDYEAQDLMGSERVG